MKAAHEIQRAHDMLASIQSMSSDQCPPAHLELVSVARQALCWVLQDKCFSGRPHPIDTTAETMKALGYEMVPVDSPEGRPPMVSARRRRRTVIPLPFRVYFHQECLTSTQGDGVVEVDVPMIISKATRSGWVLDCLDLTNLHAVYCKQTRAKRRATLAPVLRKAAELVAEQKINPRHVRGWTRWFPNHVVAQVWAELRL